MVVDHPRKITFIGQNNDGCKVVRFIFQAGMMKPKTKDDEEIEIEMNLDVSTRWHDYILRNHFHITKIHGDLI
jgi:hypothetical protein